MSAARSDQVRLSIDQLQAAAARVDLGDFPSVLAVAWRHATIDRRKAAMEVATRELQAAHLIANGVMRPDLEAALAALGRPDRELAMRLVTPDGVARISAVRRGPLCVLARRIGDDVTLQILGHTVELPTVVSTLRAQLPKAPPADIPAFGAPLDDMTQSLSGTHDGLGLADRIRALGAPPPTAMQLGTALGSRQAFVEIVSYAFAHEQGRIVRAPAAVAVIYTKRGRIIAAPSASPDGQLWATLKPGSDHIFGQAISQLIDTSTHSWGCSELECDVS